jgi:hypothetical protein
MWGGRISRFLFLITISTRAPRADYAPAKDAVSSRSEYMKINATKHKSTRQNKQRLSKSGQGNGPIQGVWSVPTQATVRQGSN